MYHNNSISLLIVIILFIFCYSFTILPAKISESHVGRSAARWVWGGSPLDAPTETHSPPSETREDTNPPAAFGLPGSRTGVSQQPSQAPLCQKRRKESCDPQPGLNWPQQPLGMGGRTGPLGGVGGDQFSNEGGLVAGCSLLNKTKKGHEALPFLM